MTSARLLNGLLLLHGDGGGLLLGVVKVLFPGQPGLAWYVNCSTLGVCVRRSAYPWRLAMPDHAGTRAPCQEIMGFVHVFEPNALHIWPAGVSRDHELCQEIGTFLFAYGKNNNFSLSLSVN